MAIDFSPRFLAASLSQRGQGHAAHRTHFDGHLVVGAADTAGLHLDHGLDVIDRHGEGFHRVFAGVLLLDLLEGTVDDALGDRLLAALHDDVHELGELDIAVLGIRQDFTFRDFATTWHFSPLNCFSWRLGRHRKNHFGFHLLDPQRVTTLHHRATRETAPIYPKNRGLT